jgi:transposase
MAKAKDNSKSKSSDNGTDNPFDSDISAIQFITTWQSSPNVTAVLTALGMSRGAAYQRAASYRKKGVALKKMPRQGRTGHDWSELNALAQSVLSESLNGLEG